MTAGRLDPIVERHHGLARLVLHHDLRRRRQTLVGYARMHAHTLSAISLGTCLLDCCTASPVGCMAPGQTYHVPAMGADHALMQAYPSTGAA